MGAALRKSRFQIPCPHSSHLGFAGAGRKTQPPTALNPRHITPVEIVKNFVSECFREAGCLSLNLSGCPSSFFDLRTFRPMWAPNLTRVSTNKFCYLCCQNSVMIFCLQLCLLKVIKHLQASGFGQEFSGPNNAVLQRFRLLCDNDHLYMGLVSGSECSYNGAFMLTFHHAFLHHHLKAVATRQILPVFLKNKRIYSSKHYSPTSGKKKLAIALQQHGGGGGEVRQPHKDDNCKMVPVTGGIQKFCTWHGNYCIKIKRI